MKHIMVDLETAGTGPTAAILQIGAVEFELYGDRIEDGAFFQNVSLMSGILAGCTIDEATLEWWSKQGVQAQDSLHEGPMVTLPNALLSFDWWLKGREFEGIWSHGACFDIPILEHAYRCCGIPLPWDFRKVRDTRTVFAFSGWKPALPASSFIAHRADHDAAKQACDVQWAHKIVRLQKKDEITRAVKDALDAQKRAHEQELREATARRETINTPWPEKLPDTLVVEGVVTAKKGNTDERRFDGQT
jgi:hypothetical protein